MEKHPLHIKNPELHTSPEVQRAVERQESRTDEKVSNDPAERIEVYLQRLEKLVLDPNKEQKKKDVGDIEHTKRPRALALLREMVMNEYVRPNKEQLAQGAARVEQRAARQMGIQVEYNNETLEQRGEIAVGDLESSLDQWINYLSDPNEPYPTWFRYYVFRNILNLGEYDKDKQEFPKRSKGTFKLFPDIDRGALAYIEEIMTAAQNETVLARVREAQESFETPEAALWTQQKAKAFVNMSFAKQYAEGIKSQGEITPELRAETRGEWVHYHQNDDPKELWKSLQNKGTSWCTRGYPTAETQLKCGDFYVYYTLDSIGKPTIPRIAIRMEGQSIIAEPPRGVFDSQQNLEPNMIDIIEQKLAEFGEEADAYRKKSENMRHLTLLEKKQEKKEPFTRDDLVFLYEINGIIEGFGYDEDPRIAELRQSRNTEEDILVVFDCTKEDIAHAPSQITENTKAYVGPICKTFYDPEITNEEILPEYINIFQKLPGKYVYTSFPNKEINRVTVEIGDMSSDQLISELKVADINISTTAIEMIKSQEFILSKNHGEAILIYLTVNDLGFKGSVTIDQIYKRAQILGLELCPADTGPKLRLKYQSQPLNNMFYIGIKQIPIENPYEHNWDYDWCIFTLSHNDDGLWLSACSDKPGEIDLNLNSGFIFRLRKSEKNEVKNESLLK